MSQSIYVSKTEYQPNSSPVQGELVEMDGETFYKISNSDRMRPFFMSVVSDSNHWMFISSNGGLTAGRKNSDFALFPYYTDDKITESADITGSKTLVRLSRDQKVFLWEPFSGRYKGMYEIQRNLYKNAFCNKIIFEEVNKDLQLTFRYEWNSSNLYGFVKKASIENHGKGKAAVELLDGLQNIIPYGVNPEVQNSRSNLVDAYKKSELEAKQGLGIYALSAIIVDKAEPAEALKANIVWSLGVKKPLYLISSMQLDAFRTGQNLEQESDIRGEKGAYFIHTRMELEAGGIERWMLVANVNQGPTDIARMLESLSNPSELKKELLADIDKGTERLVHLTASADGLQLTADRIRTMRHYSNVMYNIMRGGIIDSNYQLEKRDFLPYLKQANKAVYERQASKLQALPEIFDLFALRKLASGSSDADFMRLAYEYLPLKFSRRHGDPSRPWNRFSINTQSEIDGSKILDYEGNWRDIFQNWEALAHSYPEFIDSMIHKFLNASTFDGYNPYRVTKSGIDWEVIEPDDPWSYIGYWGDHQIIYLLKFLEFIEDYYPGRLMDYWGAEIFVYANVPYKIKTYQEVLENPKDTIDFDHELEDAIVKRKDGLGADGAVIWSKDQRPHHVNLLEKLLASLLAKVSNFIPEGGIWLNTQRPEWNDANNALVGNGVSMVTLYYMRRFLSYFREMLENYKPESVHISSELNDFFSSMSDTLESHKGVLKGKVSDKQRKAIVDALGKAASTYRWDIYKNGYSGAKAAVSSESLLHFTNTTLEYLDHTIVANERADKLYHSYNLMSVKGDGIGISYLNEMLEGQVAVLSSGYLQPAAALQVMDALRKSALYRKDQYSYILYPDKNLPRFVDKNTVPAKEVKASDLLKQLVADGNRQLIEQDVDGDYHFNGNFINAGSLKEALKGLPEKYQDLVKSDKEKVLDIFEAVFDHKSFTGRSGTFFGYEGLGSIYWHMVSKLLLAVEECCLQALDSGADASITNRLIEHYEHINKGIGFHKPPALYGAFPTDPYSHTPAHRGAQQPGMTGQVKEDILARKDELGLRIQGGCLHFGKGIFQEAEYLKTTSVFNYVDCDGKKQQLDVPAGSLAFTYCQVPIVYSQANKGSVELHLNDGSVKRFEGLKLDASHSDEIFRRTGKVEQIRVYL
ncbi:hypothetical protein [Robiginitalea sp. IMCC43444]|uniref:hypothetical protein n=1 Tax=Robiginitalea sp. IMCC43444 TaxID=3459121 RepID=UPI0040418E14